jgi:hypothetical protein
VAKTTLEPLDEAAKDAGKYSSAGSMLADKMPNLVKGAGFAQPGGNKPLDDHAEIFSRSFEAEKAIRKATKQGLASPSKVMKGLNPAFASQFGLFMAQGAPGYGSGMQQLTQQLTQAFADLGKNITLTSPLASGFVPFDLVAPSRLIYPVYTPLRNKLPRVPGQGTARQVKAVTGISGSQTGSSGGRFKRTSISELPAALSGQNWPLNLPDSGTQDAVDLNVPYRFFGMSESLSWLSQFSGQGFEDISALANLILLQQFMLAEEATILSARTQALSAPSAPTGSAETTGAPTGTAAWGSTQSVWVRVTAATLLGETAAVVGAAAVSMTAGSFLKVVVGSVPGATHYNVYLGTGSSDPGAAASHFAGTIGSGGTGWISGPAAPTTGSAAPTADSSSASTDYDGLLAILAGQASTSAYPAGFKGGYYNADVAASLSTDVVNTMLTALWDGPGAYRADPAELIVEGSDAARLADSIASNASNNAYRLYIEQGEVGGIRAGAAVSEFQNPITRSVLKILVHPWLPQGNALAMSYTLPQAMTNVSNAFEMTMVQDYLSISWPVIDASFRYSMYMYGALVAQAPQYSGLLQGITA